MSRHSEKEYLLKVILFFSMIKFAFPFQVRRASVPRDTSLIFGMMVPGHPSDPSPLMLLKLINMVRRINTAVRRLGLLRGLILLVRPAVNTGLRRIIMAKAIMLVRTNITVKTKTTRRIMLMPKAKLKIMEMME